MDIWSSYSTESSANRQPRYANNSLQQNPSPQHPRDHNPPQQPPSNMATTSGPGATVQQPYQAYHGTGGGAPPAQPAPPTRLDNTSDYMDVQMPDADPYNRAKYQQPQTRAPFVPSEEPAVSQRYGGMNTTANTQAAYSSSASSHSLPQVNYTPQMPSSSSSSYQPRQSPSRPNYSSSSQPFYSQQPPSASPRTSAPPSMQSYQHQLQHHQSASGSPGLHHIFRVLYHVY
jgi:dual specificity protein kinase YAK1